MILQLFEESHTSYCLGWVTKPMRLIASFLDNVNSVAFFIEGALAVKYPVIAIALMGVTALAVFLTSYKITKEAA